ncbi:MAG: sensor histidine kinase [Terrabacter sp.]
MVYWTAARVDPGHAAYEGGGLMDDTGTTVDTSERYASFFTHHPHATYSVDARGYYTDANPLALEMTGLTLEEMRQVRFAAVIHPDDLHVIEAAFDDAMAGEPRVVEARVVRVDGEIVHIRCTAIPLIVGGEIIGVHGVSEDITEAKRLVRELEEANLAKTLFLATVSHEVRTPLAALTGATDLLMASDLDAEPAHFVDMVHRSSQRLVHLVDDLLEFSGLEAHQTVLHPRTFVVRDLVDDVAQWAVPMAEGRGLTLSVAVDDSVPARAVGDPRRITQVVAHLVQNAITFTEHGGVELRVRARPPAPDPGDAHATEAWVEFIVSDTGTGISPEHVEALFEPFMQADRYTVRSRRGIGLGLAICRALVELMDGRMQVASTLGEGSTFTFGLPLSGCSDR